MDNLEQIRELDKSVKKPAYPESVYNIPYIQFLVPYDQFSKQGGLLPRDLPAYQWSGYFRERDLLLLSAPKREAQWANAVNTAVSKMASLAWELESDNPRIRSKVQDWLLNAGAGLGLFGWVKFLTMHQRAYLGCGWAFIEIERATPANGSKVINIHHLNPLRCRLTGNTETPVAYLQEQGGEVLLKWWQVMVITDQLDPTEGAYGIVQSATERAWPAITKMNAIEWYIYEKVSGKRPLAIHLVGGITSGTVDDAIESSQHDSERKGRNSFMGAAIVPVPSDTGINLVTIPLAELPDGFNAQEERDRADLIYANAIGLDPQDLNPRLLASGSIGTGTQAKILAEKSKGEGLASWKQQFSHELNQLALDDKVLFTFREADYADQKAKSELTKMRTDTIIAQVTAQLITVEQGRNLLVDSGDLPREFISQDATAGGVIRDSDKPEVEEVATEADPPPAEVVAPEATKERALNTLIDDALLYLENY